MSSTPISIRSATPSDAAIIADFNTRLALESENKRLQPDVIAAGVAELLANPHHGRYFVAEIDSRVVGQMMHTREWSDWRNGEIWWLQSVYVHPDYRRRGVFRALMQHLIDLAKSTPSIVGLRLYMANDNQTAQQTYERCGFQFEQYVVLEQMFSDEHRLS